MMRGAHTVVSHDSCMRTTIWSTTHPAQMKSISPRRWRTRTEMSSSGWVRKRRSPKPPIREGRVKRTMIPATASTTTRSARTHQGLGTYTGPNPG